MKPEYNVFLDERDVIISEEWSSRISEDIKANRIYKFDSEFVNMILLEDRPKVLSMVMDLYLLSENYEDAAILRDLMIEFKY